LSALLRVADGLDRGHTAAVETVTAELTPKTLTLKVAPRLKGADVELECWGGSRKSDVLAKLLDRDVEIVTLASAPAEG
jgi:exopolyphosphatase/guanosine-5'-triphosphate,3'-diphosphate pyrophosphatase